jgi:hypothetical protein
MSSEQTEAFVHFALAFEKGFAADDWRVLEPQIADDVVWIVAEMPEPIGGVHRGAKATLAAIAASCDAFDRRFDAREPRILEGPTPIPGGVHLTWVVTYRREGLEPFELRGEEWDFFRDGKLELHRERMQNLAEGLAFVHQHDRALRPALKR